MRISFVATLLLAATLASCDDESCTEIGCDGTPVSVVVLGPNWGPLAPGAYAVTLELDGERFDATCTTGEGARTCEPVEGGTRLTVDAFVTTSDRITLSIGADDPSELPDDWSAMVFVDEAVVAERDGTFTYAEKQPNGPGCEPTCRKSDGAFVAVE